MGILTDVYNQFLQVLNFSYTDAQPIWTTFFVMLAVAEIMRQYVRPSTNPLSFVLIGVRFGVFAWLLNNWQAITSEFLELMIHLGVTLGQDNITAAEFQNPSLLSDQGYRLAWHLLSYQPQGGLWTMIASIPTTIMMYVLGLLVICAYFVMALLVMFAYLSIHIAALLAVFLLPFGIHRWTVFLAEGVFGSLISHGVRVMAMAFVASIAFPIIIAHTVSVNPTLESAFTLMFLTMVVLVMFIIVPGVAAGLLTGSSHLGAGAIVGSMAAMAAAPLALGAMSRFAAQKVISVGRGAANTSMYIAGAGSAMKTAGQLGAQATGSTSPAVRALGAVKGVGQSVGYALATPVRMSYQGVSQAYQHAQLAGSQAGYRAMGQGPVNVKSAWAAQNVKAGHPPVGYSAGPTQRLPFVQQRPPSPRSGLNASSVLTTIHRLGHIGGANHSSTNVKL